MAVTFVAEATAPFAGVVGPMLMAEEGIGTIGWPPVALVDAGVGRADRGVSDTALVNV